MSPRIKSILAPLASLKLTVVLLVMSMILIYAGTWAQIDTGIWQVQKKYFHSLFTWINFATFLPRPRPGESPIPGGFPMLGGYALGVLLLLNLIAAHTVRFKFNARRIGVILIHFGLILLLVGEGITSTMATESQMIIDVGSRASYSMDTRATELALIDPSNPEHDDVIAIPESRLHKGAVIKHSAMPVEVHVDEYFANSSVLGPKQAGDKADARATAGDGVGITVIERPPISGTEADTMDAASAYITLKRDGTTVGTYLASLYLDRPQEVRIGDETWLIALRFKRLYKPYTMHLIDFRHDKYLGTDVPKDFSSHVRLVDPTRNVDREVRIWMNNPLRYEGETFYQSGFRPGDKTTILQVVENPGWVMPYVACAVGALGLLIHFGIKLFGFVVKNRTPKNAQISEAGPASGWTSFGTAIALVFVAAIFAMSLGSALRPVGAGSSFDLKTFASLPLSHEGRVQPLDSLARNSLKMISGRETFAVDEGKLPAIRWLADVFAQPDKAMKYPVFRIDHKDILAMLNLDAARKRFSLDELLTSRDKLQEQLDRATATRRNDAKSLDLFQRKLLELGDKLNLYFQLARIETLYLIPPFQTGEQWQPMTNAMQSGSIHPAARAYSTILGAYHDNDAATFNREVLSYAAQVREKVPAGKKADFEAGFNRVDPFTHCIALYLTAFVMVCLSWLFWAVPLRRGALIATLVALAIHTAGILARMYISGRPPVVSNLASTAIFISWGAIVLAMALEFFYRNGIGIVCAATMGFLSLLIADRLALSGDTLKVLQAVLDTNFWLATHVTIITLGYSATFLAGIIGVVYVIGGVFTRAIDKDRSKELARMIYGIACFAILFSFVGTILGGIWADQSWGRFWGWDPKENGAVLIVLSNALLLHARWGGLVRERGLACLAIFGNIVTAWSWFGVNMLGVGLHSYGFMDSALKWLLLFVVSQVALIVAANMPLAWWRSYSRLKTAELRSPGSALPRAHPKPA